MGNHMDRKDCCVKKTLKEIYKKTFSLVGFDSECIAEEFFIPGDRAATFIQDYFDKKEKMFALRFIRGKIKFFPRVCIPYHFFVWDIISMM